MTSTYRYYQSTLLSLKNLLWTINWNFPPETYLFPSSSSCSLPSSPSRLPPLYELINRLIPFSCHHLFSTQALSSYTEKMSCRSQGCSSMTVSMCFQQSEKNVEYVLICIKKISFSLRHAPIVYSLYLLSQIFEMDWWIKELIDKSRCFIVEDFKLYINN